jgi:hypothetical protein
MSFKEKVDDARTHGRTDGRTMDDGQKAILKAHPELCSGELKKGHNFKNIDSRVMGLVGNDVLLVMMYNLMVNKYSKFQVDISGSLKVMDQSAYFV